MRLYAEKTKSFRRDLKKALRSKSTADLLLLEAVSDLIISQAPIPEQFKDHMLSGEWLSYRDLHITNDWVLIYKVIKDENRVIFTRLGSHAELFG